LNRKIPEKLAEREGFDSFCGVEKRQVIDFVMSTVSRILRLFEKSVRKRYMAINAKERKPVRMFA
jgi:hypothetical protein